MAHSSSSSRLLAGTTALLLVLMGAPVAPARAVEETAAGSLSGRIFMPDARTPVPGAVVKAFNRGSEAMVQSAATGPDGAYRIEGLPPGEYDLGIGTPAGIYLVDAGLTLAPGQKRAVSFSLQPEEEAPPAEEPKAKTGEPGSGSGQPGQPAAQTPQKKRKLRRPGTSSVSALAATGIIVGGAIVVGALANSVSNDDDGSPN